MREARLRRVDGESGRHMDDRQRPEGALGGLLSRIPLRSRLAATIGVIVGMFASIVLSGAGDGVSMAALWIGVGGGIATAVVLWVREVRR
jgi:hypothetical protein